MSSRLTSAAIPPDPQPDHRIALSAVVEARSLIDPVFLNSPCYVCEPLGAALGCELSIKVETLNPVRSFKGRGASLLARRLAADLRGSERPPVVSASAGNWGQALAYSCRDVGAPLVLYAPVDANPLKVERMRAFGADVRLEGRDFDDAKAAARRFADASGGRLATDGLDVESGVGAATIGVELAAHGGFDVVLAPLGNGGLLTGVGRWIKAVSPGVEVIGVSAVGADAMAASWRSGRIVRRRRVETIADGIAVRTPIEEAVADMSGTVDDVLLVSDEAIVAAIRRLFADAGLLVEPAGAVGIAALLAFRARFAGRRVATVLAGANLTQAQIRDYRLLARRS